jgi:hypothetical protein
MNNYLISSGASQLFNSLPFRTKNIFRSLPARFRNVPFLIFIYCSIYCSCCAQQFTVIDYRKELNIKLDVIDEKRLEKGVESLNEALSIETEALRILDNVNDDEKALGISSDYNKVINKLVQASELYKQGHGLIFTVFNEDCGKFTDVMRKMNHYASGMNKAKYYEIKGESTLEKSIRIRNIVPEANKAEWIQYKMHEALELEKLAIRDVGRALQVYQDFPVEYNYGWDNDVTPEQLARFFDNPSVKLPPEDAFTKKPVEVAVAPEEKIIFRVQIAAHTVPLQKDYIRTFYTGKDTVQEVHEGKWYKYQIGTLDSFESADSLQRTCRVPRAFVVAYQADRRLTIKEALTILRGGQ